MVSTLSEPLNCIICILYILKHGARPINKTLSMTFYHFDDRPTIADVPDGDLSCIIWKMDVTGQSYPTQVIPMPGWLVLD